MLRAGLDAEPGSKTSGLLTCWSPILLGQVTAPFWRPRGAQLEKWCKHPHPKSYHHLLVPAQPPGR